MPKGIEFHFLNGKHFSSRLKKKIRHEATIAFEKIHALIQEQPLNVFFHHAPDRTIPGLYIGGYCPNSLNLNIYLDTGYKRILSVVKGMMKNTLAHEYHHASRWASPGYGRALGKAIISEGLADIFSLEAFPAEPPPWCTALGQEQTEVLLQRAAASFNQKNYNHVDWFFGDGSDHPRWGGYTLGYKVVKSYLERHPKKTAASLVHTPASTILKGRGLVRDFA